LTTLEALLGGRVPVPVVETDGRAIVLDLSAGSVALGDPLMGMTVGRFTERMQLRMQEAGTRFAYGRWGERRELYGNEHFAVDDPERKRDVHLGVDLFCDPDTPVRAPLPGRVILEANNARELDYGPLLVLEHDLSGTPFYTLYGHLSSASTVVIEPGQAVEAGEIIARVGEPPENGNWSPHLHFQVILDLLGMDADFPGVCSVHDCARWFSLSPLPSVFFPDVLPGALDGRDTAQAGAAEASG
jgi:murein DD-endopeptidase MepM/ murein hydrolase activator NlpD